MFGKYFGGVVALLCSMSAFAAAPVEESRGSATSQIPIITKNVVEIDNRYEDQNITTLVTEDELEARPSNLFYQIQLLQEEVASLRGQLEEQSFRIERMGRDQASRYADLDKRLYEIGSGDTGLLVHQRRSESGTEPIAGPKTEEQSYRSAFELIREKRFDDAVTALNSFIVDYPNGQFTPNAFYWLGEVYLVRFQDQMASSDVENNGMDDLENARQHFVQIVTLYPDHSKVPDALYKLGTVYHQLGNVSRALDYLDRVISTYPTATAAGLARSYSNELR